MKLSVYLTDSKNPHDGITIMIKNMLSYCKEIDFIGKAYLSIGENKQKMQDYYDSNFPFMKTKVKKLAYPQKVITHLSGFKVPLSVNKFMSGCDAQLYFHNFIPRNNIKGKKIVFIHDVTPIRDETMKNRKILKIFNYYNYYYKLFKNSTEKADLIFTVSNFSKEDIIKTYPVAKNKIKVVYPGVMIEKFEIRATDEEINKVKQKYNLPKKYILFVGQPRENKNLKRLLKAYSMLDNNFKDEFGLVYANTTEELNKLSKELNVENYVRLLNGVDEEDIVPVYQASSCVTLVSTNEGFGLPLVEAMASKVPVLASNVSCLPEIVGDAGVLVNPYSEEEIKTGLEKILTDSELRQKLIKLGEERAKFFTWENCAKNFEKYVEEFLSKND